MTLKEASEAYNLFYKKDNLCQALSDIIWKTRPYNKISGATSIYNACMLKTITTMINVGVKMCQRMVTLIISIRNIYPV